MPVSIYGVRIADPTAAWMELKTVREVLRSRRAWNKGGWFDMRFETMCLANAVRYVHKGYRSNRGDFSNALRPVTESLLLAVVQRRHSIYASIPAYNDDHTRLHSEILEVIDEAIELLEPHARTEAYVIASEVLTKKEQQEMAEEQQERQKDRFQEWLQSHERRGWKTFWEELRECPPDDEECQQRKALSAA